MGDYCQDENPCRNEYCMNGAKCDVYVNDYDEFKARCTCAIGYTGMICERIDDNSPCKDNPCKNQGRCSVGNTLQEYSCKCMTGYRGTNCEYEDHCASRPCRNGGTCNPTIHGFECSCPAGYRDVTCMEDVDECAEDPDICRNGGTCWNQHGSYT
ncbi:neurogenic locus notch protein [Plakobranchus ocellatus]|uniref:Neurogenic locus notch protein n=1 Tax=Plakobranchus ocellatus TaxID=259542 RepID=A0AAV4B9H0_9GAST|nr:neurogenic locus notch protein [Plakobranchus ocellatus]